MTVAFVIEGATFTALNGGPVYKFTEAISFVISCTTQVEVDYYWDRLKEGGPVEAQQCGWLKDKFGLSWQIIPEQMGALLSDPDPERSQRAMQAMLQMQ